MMSASGVPALEVSNGFVRVGSLVQIKVGLAKGSVTAFSLPNHTVTIKLADGSEVTMKAAEVARQIPHATGTVPPTKCQKCAGLGVRDSYLGGIFGPEKPCLECEGTGRTPLPPAPASPPKPPCLRPNSVEAPAVSAAIAQHSDIPSVPPDGAPASPEVVSSE